jgi:hypothetical protein
MNCDYAILLGKELCPSWRRKLFCEIFDLTRSVLFREAMCQNRYAVVQFGTRVPPPSDPEFRRPLSAQRTGLDRRIHTSSLI